MKFPLSLLLVLSAAPLCAADDAAALDLLPPGARIVFGMRVRGVVDSALAQTLTSEIKSATADWQKLISLAGFDPLHDLDEILLASTGEGKESPVLIVARGTFDTVRWGAKAKPYHDVPLVTGDDKSGVFAILNGSTVLAGDLAEVKAAIDRRGSPATLDVALMTRIADYRRQYELWGVADHPAGLAKRFSDSGGPQPFDSIDRFQFGLGLRHGLEIAAEVHTRSAEDARQLTSSLRLVEAMFKASQPSSKGTNLNIESHEDTLKITLAISEEDLKKAADQQRQRTPVAAAPAPVPAPSPENRNRPAVQPGDGTSVVTLPGRR